MPEHIINRSKCVSGKALTESAVHVAPKQPQLRSDNEAHTTASAAQHSLPAGTAPKNNDTSSSNVSPVRAFRKGDRVYAAYLDQAGIVSEEEDNRGQIGVMIRGRKLKIHKKRLRLHISADELYPGNYDLDIVLETKENRKNAS